jgi:hypothetical protein
MIGAMLTKQAIARTKPGQARYVAPGAKSKGTYTKAGASGKGDALNPTGKVAYGHGTPAGVKKYYKFVGGHAGASAAGEMKGGSKTKKTAAEIAASAKAKLSGGKQFKAAAKKGPEMAKAKAGLLAKKKPTVKGKQSLVASVQGPAAVSKVTESSSGAGMARKIIQINESLHQPR